MGAGGLPSAMKGFQTALGIEGTGKLCPHSPTYTRGGESKVGPDARVSRQTVIGV